MKNEGLNYFIPISRKIFEHQFWLQEREFSVFEAWLYLIEQARFENSEVFNKGRSVKVKRGQLYVSLRYLSSVWKWSKNRVNSFLKTLEKLGMIVKETDKKTGQTLITLSNYETYNANPQKKGQ